MKRGAIPFIKKTLIVMPLLRHWVLDFLNRRQTTELVSAGNTTHIICKKNCSLHTYAILVLFSAFLFFGCVSCLPGFVPLVIWAAC
jgi:hypothetical protein